MSKYLPKQDAAQIKAAISPYDFYLKEQDLDRFRSKLNLWAVAGLCPFHDDRTAGSFSVHLDAGAFKCFSCGR